MKRVVCPHCGNQRVNAARMPRDVIAVLACPSCHELVVLYRAKAIALSREIITNGTFEEKKEHIAGIVAEFLEGGFLSFNEDSLDDLNSALQGKHKDEGGPDFEDANAAGDDDGGREEGERPISQREFERFVRVDLKRIDDPAYFRRHFGQ